MPRLDWISRPEVRALVECLPPRQHKVIVLRYLLGLSHSEAARVLGISEQAVGYSHHAALRGLAQALAALPREPARATHPLRGLRLPRRLAGAGFSLLPRLRAVWR